MRDNRNESFQNMMKVAKRIAIEILISLPFCIMFGYLTRNHIKGFLQVLCFMVVMAVAVVVGELIYKHRQKKKIEQEILNPKRDVFK